MLWLVLGSICLCGAILMCLRDRRATETVTFIDRSQLRRSGGILVGISGTILVGLLVLNLLANWVASDL